MTDLISDKSDGDILYASDINNMLAERDGHFLPISNTTKNYVDATQNVGSATYRFLNGYFSTAVFTKKIQSDSSAGLLLLEDGGSGIFVQDGGNVGIGTTNPLSILHINDPSFNGLRISDNETSLNAKYLTIVASQYDSASESEGFLALGAGSGVASNEIYIGGNSASKNAATSISFFTASNTTTRAGTERLRINNSGNVGIGTTNPLSILHINDPSFTGLRISDNETSLNAKYLTIVASQYDSASESEGFLALGTGSGVSSNEIYIGGNSSSKNAATSISFFTASNTTTRSGTEILRINNSGNVGIGTTVPDRKLEINDSSGNCLRLTYNDSNGSATNYIDFLVSSAGNLSINASGTTTSLASALVVTETTEQLRLRYDVDNYAAFTISSGGDLTIAPSGGDISFNDTFLKVTKTTEQLRLLYDPSNYASFTVSSGGDLTIAPSGGDTTITGHLSCSTIGCTGITATAQMNITATSIPLRLKYDNSNYCNFHILSNGTLELATTSGSIYFFGTALSFSTTRVDFYSSYLVITQADQTNPQLQLHNSTASGSSTITTRDNGSLRITPKSTKSCFAGAIGITDGVSEPSTDADGFALIYVDSGDGDLKIKFSDGTVKVIVADT